MVLKVMWTALILFIPTFFFAAAAEIGSWLETLFVAAIILEIFTFLCSILALVWV